MNTTPTVVSNLSLHRTPSPPLTRNTGNTLQDQDLKENESYVVIKPAPGAPQCASRFPLCPLEHEIELYTRPAESANHNRCELHHTPETPANTRISPPRTGRAETQPRRTSAIEARADQPDQWISGSVDQTSLRSSRDGLKTQRASQRWNSFSASVSIRAWKTADSRTPAAASLLR